MEDKLRKLNVEVTTNCNLECAMCMRRVWNEESGDMSLETFKALVPAFAQIETINIIGIGEPLLNENIFEMISLGRKNLPAQGTISMTTNATLIDQSIAEKIVTSGLTDLVISLDGACAETYNRIRSGADFYTVLSKLNLVNTVKEDFKSSIPRIGLEFVAMKDNVAELPQLVDLAAQNNVAFIIVSNILPHTVEMNEQVLYDKNSDKAIELFNEAKKEASNRSLKIEFDTPDVENYANALFGRPPIKDKLRTGHTKYEDIPGYNEGMRKKLQLLDEVVANARQQNVLMSFKDLIPRNDEFIHNVEKIFDDARVRAAKHGISLNLPPLIPRTDRECGFIKEGISFISWDGYVRPCNNLYHSYMCYVNSREKSITKWDFGNVLQRDFIDIWNSREYRSFRKKVLKFDFAPCGDCPHSEGCFALRYPVFRMDCYEYTLPCGDCPWARGILQCM